MKQLFEEAQKEYMNASAAVSEQLDQMLEETMAQSGLDPGDGMNSPSPWIPYWRTIKTVLYFVIVVTVLLNISEGFANTLSNIPWVGPIAEMLTFRDYSK